MSVRFLLIPALLCLVAPTEGFAKGSPVTVKICDSNCKRRAPSHESRQETKVAPVVAQARVATPFSVSDI